MGFFDFLKASDINSGVEEWKQSSNGVLIDVRTVEEYRQGHIPGSINIPLDNIRLIETKVKDKNLPIFLHCLSGVRSAQAEKMVKQLGYMNAKNIGGFNSYRGEVEA
ncbi:MAG: rhodanese-like domain-containing protein [Anaerotardibacter sp.]